MSTPTSKRSKEFQYRLDDVLEQQLHGKIRRDVLKKVDPTSMLQHMHCVNETTKQRIEQTDKNDGQQRAVGKFLGEVKRFSGWGAQFLDGLYYTGHKDLAMSIYPQYVAPYPDPEPLSFHNEQRPPYPPPPPPPYSPSYYSPYDGQENDETHPKSALSSVLSSFAEENIIQDQDQALQKFAVGSNATEWSLANNASSSVQDNAQNTYARAEPVSCGAQTVTNLRSQYPWSYAPNIPIQEMPSTSFNEITQEDSVLKIKKQTEFDEGTQKFKQKSEEMSSRMNKTTHNGSESYDRNDLKLSKYSLKLSKYGEQQIPSFTSEAVQMSVEYKPASSPRHVAPSSSNDLFTSGPEHLKRTKHQGNSNFADFESQTVPKVPADSGYEGSSGLISTNSDLSVNQSLENSKSAGNTEPQSGEKIIINTSTENLNLISPVSQTGSESCNYSENSLENGKVKTLISKEQSGVSLSFPTASLPFENDQDLCPVSKYEDDIVNRSDVTIHNVNLRSNIQASVENRNNSITTECQVKSADEARNQNDIFQNPTSSSGSSQVSNGVKSSEINGTTPPATENQHNVTQLENRQKEPSKIDQSENDIPPHDESLSNGQILFLNHDNDPASQTNEQNNTEGENQVNGQDPTTEWLVLRLLKNLRFFITLEDGSV
uniref:Dentin sialophosphoprotein n=1 Tax=Phallusia mammillata TaxID=59560 RepID=A0A6F9DBZ4_9ASCI|nr:dentin sialophosphoprotein [Phallusia mammillata]